ncbi:hypothetical protein Tco_0671646 [Tanacetum coccineum]
MKKKSTKTHLEIRVNSKIGSLPRHVKPRTWICIHAKRQGKENIVADALSRKERVKPRRVRAMAMTIQSGVKRMILVAQSKAFKQVNATAEMLRGLDQLMERKEDEDMYFMVSLIGDVRTLIMDEAHASSDDTHDVTPRVFALAGCDMKPPRSKWPLLLDRLRAMLPSVQDQQQPIPPKVPCRPNLFDDESDDEESDMTLDACV